MQIEKNGVMYTFSLDTDYILDLEAKDPSFSFFEELGKLGEDMRLTTLFNLTKFIGWNYRDFVAKGFTMDDLVGILSDCMEELGFRSATPTQN